MKPQTYNFPSLVRGDTFDGLAELTVTVNDAAPAEALSSVRMQFRSSLKASEKLAELSSAGGEIVIEDPDAWRISIPAGDLALPVGVAYYDMEFTDAAGKRKTYLAGTLEVLQDVTR